jgi:hypothetical protein
LGLEVRARKVEKALASAAWEAHGELFGYGNGEELPPFSLDLHVVVEPGRRWRLAAEPSVEEQIRRAVQEVAIKADVFHYGRVYCYRCESSQCAHSIPPRPGSVFGGYSSTGLPLWPELAQVLLDLRHPHVDRLYRDEDRELLAVFLDAQTLKGRQLNIFGRQSKTYNILGQVVLGFLYLSHPGRENPLVERVALTLQAVESRRSHGSVRIDLNVLGRLWDGLPAVDALKGPFQLRVLKIIVEARRRIQNLTPTTRRGGPQPHDPAAVRAGAESILRDLERSITRLGRQRSRRTGHAEERGKLNRPISKALEDATCAQPDKILWDARRENIVVLGPKNRVHVFNQEGMLITSIILSTEAINKRLMRRRWVQLRGDKLEIFNAALGRGQRSSVDGEPSDDALARGSKEPNETDALKEGDLRDG